MIEVAKPGGQERRLHHAHAKRALFGPLVLCAHQTPKSARILPKRQGFDDNVAERALQHVDVAADGAGVG